jgi:hypothetical protein
MRLLTMRQHRDCRSFRSFVPPPTRGEAADAPATPPTPPPPAPPPCSPRPRPRARV